MKKFSRLKSFDDFKANKNIQESVTPNNAKAVEVQSVKEHKTVVTKQRQKLQKINEAAFKVGDDYKVKITIDVPVSLVKAYIEKVSQETGRNALDNFSETEIAEQMVQHTLKHNLHLDSIPASVTVGDSLAQEELTADQQVDAAMLGAEFGDNQTELSTDDSEIELELDDSGEEIEITDSELTLDNEDADADIEVDSEELELDDIEEAGEELEGEFGDEKTDGEELELEDDTEANLGEVRSVENDGEVSDNTEEAEETEEEEEYIIDDEDNSMRVFDMMNELSRSGLDPRGMADDQIVDLWNDIFGDSNNPINGLDETGAIIMPSIF
jgi:hypothetical protein